MQTAAVNAGIRPHSLDLRDKPQDSTVGDISDLPTASAGGSSACRGPLPTTRQIGANGFALTRSASPIKISTSPRGASLEVRTASTTRARVSARGSSGATTRTSGHDVKRPRHPPPRQSSMYRRSFSPKYRVRSVPRSISRKASSSYSEVVYTRCASGTTAPAPTRSAALQSDSHSTS